MPISINNTLLAGVPSFERAAIFGGTADTATSNIESNYSNWPPNDINFAKIGARNVTTVITRAIEDGSLSVVETLPKFDGSTITLLPLDYDWPAITDPTDLTQTRWWSSTGSNSASERKALAAFYTDQNNADRSWYGMRFRGAISTTARFGGIMRASDSLTATDTDCRCSWPLDGTIDSGALRFAYVSGTNQSLTVILRIAGADVAAFTFNVSPTSTFQYATLSGLSIAITNGQALNFRVVGSSATNGTMDVQLLMGFVPD